MAVVEFTRNDPDRNLWMSCSQTEGNTRCTDFQGLKMAFIIDEPLGKATAVVCKRVSQTLVNVQHGLIHERVDND